LRGSECRVRGYVDNSAGDILDDRKCMFRYGTPMVPVDKRVGVIQMEFEMFRV